MTIKRKTHLNLSGSHHTLDSDNAFVGGTVYVTGSVSASIGKFQQLTGSLSGTLGGSPFLVAGSNMGGVNYNAATGQWEITGSAGTSVAGLNTYVQFNKDGNEHGASAQLTFNTSSYNGYAANTLAFPSGAVGVVKGVNTDNNFSILEHNLIVSVETYLGTEPEFSGSVPNIQLTGSALVITGSHLLVSNSFIIADGTYVSTSLSAAVGGGDYEEQSAIVNNVLNGGLGGFGGFLAQNGAGYQLYSNNYGTSQLGGEDPIFVAGRGTGDLTSKADVLVVGQLTVLSASTDQNARFSVRPAPDVGQLELRHVGSATFISGAITVGDGASIFFTSGSIDNAFNSPGFVVQPSFTSPGAEVIINSGSFTFNSSSQDAQAQNYSFQILPAAFDAHKADVVFDRGLDTAQFAGINIRPLYATMSTAGASGIEMSGSLLENLSTGPYSIGKIDLNVIAVQSDSDDYGSWTFSATVARNSGGNINVIAYSELDAATSGSNAAGAPGWDVNINNDGKIYCTGSTGGGIQWYAQITKKMFLSGSGLITY